MFARYDIPDVLVPDNKPQFTSAKLASFENLIFFLHVTSSLHYVQSNGKADSAVKTVH